MRRRSGPIDVDTIEELIEAVRLNAEDLCAEATLLFEHEHHARTYALAELAVEEFAKCYDLLSLEMATLVGFELPEDVWEHFWKKWADHEFKTKVGLTVDFIRQWATQMAGRATSEGWTAPPNLLETLRYVHPQLVSAATGHRDLVQQRLDALYVDYRNNNVIQPSDRISPESAERMLDFARLNIEFLRTMPEWGDFKQIAAHSAQMGHLFRGNGPPLTEVA
jgi:AbiV family abortive infection protein